MSEEWVNDPNESSTLQYPEGIKSSESSQKISFSQSSNYNSFTKYLLFFIFTVALILLFNYDYIIPC